MAGARVGTAPSGQPSSGPNSTKSLLKAIGEAVRQHKFDDAIQQARAVLQKEPRNYQAHIFLAYSLDKTNKPDESEKIYEDATKLKPADAQAWQGLIKVYERQGTKKLADYQPAVLKLAEIYRDAEDMYKCQDVVDKFLDFVRTKAERLQYANALELILPESPIYPALEGRVPHPAKTYETIAQIIEADEKKRINTLIGERRTRIGARIGDVTLEVKREVYAGSKLAHVYRELINWTNDDDLRRTYEEKLLQHRLDRLSVLQGEEKAQELEIVTKLARDMVIIKHPYKLAWDIAIDWQDPKEIDEWDDSVLWDYCLYFPDTDLSKVLTGFLTSELSPFPKRDNKPLVAAATSTNGKHGVGSDSEDDEDGGAPTSVIPLTDEDRLAMMTEGVNGADSLLAYRLTGAYYQHLEEYEGNVELMRKALEHLANQRRKTGLAFRNTEDAYTLYLATALVFYQSPRNHQEAKALFDGVLARDPTSTSALIGVGLIYEEEEDYDEAISFLERALQRDKDNLRVRTEAAWVYSLKGHHDNARSELEACITLLQVQKGQAAKELLAQTQYRLGVCLWNMDTSRAWRKDRTKAYAQFMNALKNNLNCAPAYTSLGVYYEDCAKDKKRARRCFQKAVELSPSEVESAERLARSFAEEGDWDRVELISQRVVDSGKVKPPPGSKRKGISWPFAALGVAHLNKQEYAKAIVSFQSATRISPDDYHSYVGLGESYYSSGRHFSAIKAINEAQKLELAAAGNDAANSSSSSRWFTSFLLGNINRELGAFDEAVTLYQSVLKDRPNEQGVAIALMQTMVESALGSIDSGYFGKAAKLATDTLSFAVKAPESITKTFNFWKTIADSCSVFSSVQGRVHSFPADILRQLFAARDGQYDTLADVDGVTGDVVNAQGIYPSDEKFGVDLTRCLHATILAHKRAIHVSAHDIHAQAVAYYNLGWAEHRAHTCLPWSLRKKSSRYLKAAIRCFKRAIELEAGNSEFWNALGVVTSSVNPAVSQHSFTRSLYLNERSAQVWANLGTLALFQNDPELANKAFTNAQSNEPDYAHGWLGQGFVALLLGHVKEARGLFTHAVDLSEASSSIARQQYSITVFDHILSAPPNLTALDLVLPIFALDQLRGLRPQERPYGHLFSLFQERVNNPSKSVKLLEEISSALEADYELTESAESLKQFALAKSDLARAYLGAESYEQAIECGEMALQLSSDESDNELSAEERKRARLSAHLAVGLAQYHSGDFEEALTYFEAALEESDNNPDAVCLLAQVLWANGTEDAREKARNALFEVVEKQPDHVQSVLLLGVIALLDDDEEGVDAVLAELHGIQTSDKVSPAEQKQVGEVLQAIVAREGEANGKEEERWDTRLQAQTDIMLHPHLPHGWSNLSETVDDDEDDYPSEMALQVALKAIPPRGQLGAEDLARVYAGTRKAADAQVSAMLAPWLKNGWQTLGDAIGG